MQIRTMRGTKRERGELKKMRVSLEECLDCLLRLVQQHQQQHQVKHMQLEHSRIRGGIRYPPLYPMVWQMRGQKIGEIWA